MTGGLKVGIVAGTLALLAGSNGYLLWQVKEMKADVAQWRGTMISEISELRENSLEGRKESGKRLELLQLELGEARRQAATAAGRAKTDAQKHAEVLAQKIAEEQARQQQQVASELTEVKEAAATTNTKIADVSGEVANTKSELAQTISELKRATGDMGVLSGLIATNGQELAALKQLGERNYFEFDLKKTKQPQKVGDVMIALKKTDPKRNKFTVEIVADDKKVEKKDKNTNEPVQFYVSKARQPYELVINDVKKDQIVGYLSTPKVQMARK